VKRLKLPLGCAVLAFFVACASALPAWAILSDNSLTYINQTIGATTFYDNGFDGSSAIVANIEGGYIWDQHALLTNDTVEFSDPSVTGQYDLHATAVGSVINGSLPYNGITVVNNQLVLLSEFFGIAPGAQTWSGAIATSWVDPGDGSYSGGFNISNASFSTPYLEAMVTGVPQANYQTADVITSSWGDSVGTDGNDYLSVVLDALVGESGKTLVVAAGNGGPGTDTVDSPASSINALTAGGLQSDTTTPAYSQIADFSSRSPSDFFLPYDTFGDNGKELTGVRACVDICAPATDMILAYYQGNTGGGAFGYGVSDPSTENLAYPFAGTSFAAPIVAGGAALVVDAGKTLFANDPYAIDGRVVKAVLMNSADKPAGWDNGQYVNNNGVIFTSQALDYTFGSGIIDLNQAYNQYTGGTTDLLDVSGNPTLTGGNVLPNGWAFGEITHQPRATATVDYNITTPLQAGSVFSATLAWYSNDIATPDADYADNGLDPQYGSFDNLDLSIYLLGGSQPLLIAESASLYNSVQELYFPLPTTGLYMVQVSENNYVYNFTGATTTEYGLAWTVPEPTGAALLLVGSLTMLRRRRRSTPASQRGRESLINPDDSDSLFSCQDGYGFRRAGWPITS